MSELDAGEISLIVLTLIFFIAICSLFFSTNYFKNLSYTYNLPVLGINHNIQDATVPRMGEIIEPSSSEEPSSLEEASSSEEPPIYSDQSLLIGLYSNERRNMNPYGNYVLMNNQKNKQEAKEIDNLLQRLQNASNSAFIQ